jgi:acylphosphatase
MTDKAIRYIVRYSGHVQGVCFRATAVSQAAGLDVHGLVRNEPDGSVTMDVEGTVADLKELMRRIASAMSGYIDAADIDQRPARGIDSGFRIQY